jgi:hypothetical protein
MEVGITHHIWTLAQLASIERDDRHPNLPDSSRHPRAFAWDRPLHLHDMQMVF